jgi:hypothetical protein
MHQVGSSGSAGGDYPVTSPVVYAYAQPPPYVPAAERRKGLPPHLKACAEPWVAAQALSTMRREPPASESTKDKGHGSDSTPLMEPGDLRNPPASAPPAMQQIYSGDIPSFAGSFHATSPSEDETKAKGNPTSPNKDALMMAARAMTEFGYNPANPSSSSAIGATASGNHDGAADAPVHLSPIPEGQVLEETNSPTEMGAEQSLETSVDDDKSPKRTINFEAEVGEEQGNQKKMKTESSASDAPINPDGETFFL